MTIALVDPDYARVAVERVIADMAREYGMAVADARLEEWNTARVFIAEHPLD